VHFDYNTLQPVVASGDPGEVLFGPQVINPGEATTISYTIFDETLTALTLDDGAEVYRSNNIGGNNGTITGAPDSFSADGTTAFSNVGANGSRSIGLAEDDDSAQRFGGGVTYITTDSGANFDSTAQFLFTFNGDFVAATGETVIPEPTSTALLGLGGLALLARRKRV